MTHSPLTTRTVATSKHSPRGGRKIERLIVHHTAGGTLDSNVRRLSSDPAKASATYVLGTDGTLVGVVPEEYRPWTTGSMAADGPAVTVETVNTGGGPEWRVSDVQVERLAQLAADLCRRYGWGRLDRNRVKGHREYAATACPGPHLWGQLDRIVARANQLLGTASSATPRVVGRYRVATRSSPLNGRTGPGTNHPVGMTAAKGHVLDVVEVRDGWAKSTGGWWYSMQYLTKVG
ncbi:MAG: peptidoglycan recognition family protein [Aeromicrobium sp.]|uniref:N-acetylmuramoyl-L-alanine amidase n=1 Tax=Aeromicrobium sp. TaxID=1871063 RepID=UPI0039E5866D